MGYPHWERPQLLQELHNVQTEYENWKKQKLNLNMARENQAWSSLPYPVNFLQS